MARSFATPGPFDSHRRLTFRGIVAICTRNARGPDPGTQAAWRNAAAIRRQPETNAGYMTTFSDLSLDPRVLQAVIRLRLRHPHPDPGPGHPARARRPRRARHRPDRHRQDRRLRAADGHPPLQGPRPRPHAAEPGARPDARARRPGGGAVREILRPREALHGAPDRRRQLQGPGQAHRPRRRRADRHPRPPARPLRARQADADRRADHGRRRGRPHARHGLHPRHRAHLQARALHPADALLLRHHGARDHPHHRRLPAQPGPRRGRPPGDHLRDHRPVRRAPHPAPQGHRRRREARGAAPPHPRRGRQPHQRHHLLQPQGRRRRGGEVAEAPRLQRRGDARRPRPEAPDEDPAGASATAS